MTPGSDRAAPNAISSTNDDAHRQEDIARCHRLAVAAFGAFDEPAEGDAD